MYRLQFFHRIIITGDSAAGFSQSSVHMQSEKKELISLGDRAGIDKMKYLDAQKLPKALVSLRCCTILYIP